MVSSTGWADASRSDDRNSMYVVTKSSTTSSTFSSKGSSSVMLVSIANLPPCPGSGIAKPFVGSCYENKQHSMSQQLVMYP